MRRFLAMLRHPYHLYKERKHRWIIAFSIAGFAWFMLFAFGIFEFDYFELSRRLYYTGLYAVACWLALIFNFFVIQEVFIRRLTLGNSILLSFSFMFTIGLFNFLLTTLLFQWEPFSMAVFLKNQIRILAIGLIVAPFLILTHYSYLLRKQSGNNPGFTPFKTNSRVILDSEYRNGKLEVDVRDLLYMQSADNYVDIHYLDGKMIKHMLLRNTLAAIESAVDHPGVIRCHRSYIVNLYYFKPSKKEINKLRCEAAGTELNIPVSRRYRAQVLSALGHQ